MSIAIYALSGDPITNGHINIIERATKVFDTLVVGIGHNSEKNYMFTLEKRIDMAKVSLKRFKNVEVISYSGLLVDYAYFNNIPTIVRGIRNLTDLEMEKRLLQCGRSQELGIETFFLLSEKDYEHVSSGTVKVMQENSGFIYNYVPGVVKVNLEHKISDQTIFGITGEICTGKSYITDLLVKELSNPQGDLMAYNIDLDKLGHEILDGKIPTKVFKEVREKIAYYFGSRVVLRGGKIDRKALGDIVFGDNEKLRFLNDLMRTPIRTLFRSRLKYKKGIIFINSAILAESGWLPMCNNNVILINSDKDEQYKRLQDRYSNTKHIENRLKSQKSYDDKLSIIKNEIETTNYGNLFSIDNTKYNFESQFNTLIVNIKNFQRQLK